MNQLLGRGSVACGETSGEAYTVAGFLGSGGEGEVYRGRGSCGDDVALKWFYAHTATTEKADKLRVLSGMLPPSPSFLWPREVVTSPATATFGYVMDLRPPQYCGLADLLRAKVDPTFRALCTACMELADSMHRLHARGLCYQDINDRNVFFRPDTGEARICDCDNIATNGSPATVGGTLGFMAPEIVRGEAQPSADTDRWSLAVLLFKMLVRGHPLHGRRKSLVHILDRAAKEKLYGHAPLFAFDPADRSNAPVRGIHDTVLAYWPIYPRHIRGLFEKTFTDGVADPANGRVRENQWRHALSNARDALFRCPSCRVENFFDPAVAPGTSRCWHCRSVLPAPPRLEIEGLSTVALNCDTRLCPHHLRGLTKPYDFSVPLAEVSRHPGDARVWGLRNLSSEPWSGWTPNGIEVQILPGRSVVLQDQLRLNFGGGTAGRILWT